MDSDEIQRQIEQLAETLVLAEVTDLQSLAQLHTQFLNLSSSATSLGHTHIAEVAKRAGDECERIILDEVDNSVHVFEEISAVITNVQSFYRDGINVQSLIWPEWAGERGEEGSVHTNQTTAAAPVPESSSAECAAGVPAVANHALAGDLSLLSEFVNEAREHLESAEINLLKLETPAEAEEQDALNAVFRAFHTIKGVAGFLALDDIQKLAHEAESLLDRARKHELALADAAIDVTFDAVDMMKKLVSNVCDALETGSSLTSVPTLHELIDRIKRTSSGDPIAAGNEPSVSTMAQPLGELLVETGAATQETINKALQHQRALQGHRKLGEVLVQNGAVLPTHVKMALDAQQNEGAEGRLGKILIEMKAVSAEEVAKGLKQQNAPPKLGELLVSAGEAQAKDVAQALRAQTASQAAGNQVRETVKVDADRLDLFVDMIGELVIAESMVRQSDQVRTHSSSELAHCVAQLDKITRKLQQMGTSLRMVPIRSTFQKMARLVRDLAKKSGKQVEFYTAGDDTELDKSVVDKIGDPLIHMVRNAVDHGLEPVPEDRVKAGKPAVGHIELRAFHKGGSIYIEIEDDGRGLDREAILAKARERGMVGKPDDLTDREIWNLIFEPGLSTAKTLTDVSGRGVGMDVVRRNIEALRGQIEIQSEAGKGSKFSIRLPLTLAIIDGMVVRVGDERYIVPTLSILMSIRPEPQQVSTVVGRGEMLMLQGQLLPLFRMSSLFGIDTEVLEVMQGIVVVVEDEGKRTGLLVDEILGEQQIVIKPLGDAFQGISGIAGGAIMPDGNVGLILDVGGVVNLANASHDGLSTIKSSRCRHFKKLEKAVVAKNEVATV